MKMFQPVLSLLLAMGLLFCHTATAQSTASAPKKIRVLLVVGGHDFETNAFYKVFSSNPSLTVKTVEHPRAHAWLTPEKSSEYDVVVLYDMWQPITAEQKAAFVNILKQGKGLVATHHCLASYQDWPEYAKIIGGKYHLAKETYNGSEKAPSTYKHDVDFTVSIADSSHPVTHGLSTFKIHDETYGLFSSNPDVHVLLTTDETTSSKNICWAKTYEKARVIYLELGHDHLSYENPNYQKVLDQSIKWVAGQ